MGEAALTNCSKLKLLLWKDWKSMRAAWLVLTIAAALFLGMFAYIIVMRTHKPLVTRSETKFEPVSINGSFAKAKNMLYSPKNDMYETMVGAAARRLGISEFRGCANSTAMERELIKSDYFVGVQFEDSTRTLVRPPKNFDFALRFPSELRTMAEMNWHTMTLFVSNVKGLRNPDDADGGTPVGYVQEGFIHVQNALVMAYLEQVSNVKGLPSVTMQRFPYGKFSSDADFLKSISNLAMVIALIYNLVGLSVAFFVIQEKKTQLKELMIVMGLPSWLQWLGWFLLVYSLSTIVSCLMTLLFKLSISEQGAVFQHSDWSLILLLLLVYSMANISFIFLFTLFFEDECMLALVLFILCLFSNLSMFTWFNVMEAMTLKTFLCGLSSVALGVGWHIIVDMEIAGVGLQWSNMYKMATRTNKMRFLNVIIAMLVATVFGFLLCLYLEYLFLGPFSGARKWYFPCQRAFWRRSKQRKRPSAGLAEIGESLRGKKSLENVKNRSSVIGLRMIRLEKCFHDYVAVNQVSCNVYINEITVLMGHNGAGKTTTLQMLAGMIPPTSGTAIVNGYDINTDMSLARRSLGICPQNNVLFKELTVRDHIIFYTCLKGERDKAALAVELRKYLKIMQVTEISNPRAKKLSAGMKRTLSLCCALCGGAQTVLCDEPTCGVDAISRRLIWQLLDAEKSGRVILLTTHHMDEADALGDRIAIMSTGQLSCYGRPFDLKKKFNLGYRLICNMTPKCNELTVTNFLRDRVPQIGFEGRHGYELIYRLPSHCTPKYSQLFRDLQNRQASLRLAGFVVNKASLEEVFMRLDPNKSTNSRLLKKPPLHSNAERASRVFNPFAEVHVATKRSKLCCLRLYGLLLKRWLQVKRNWFSFLLLLFLPAILLVIYLNTSSIKVHTGLLKPLTMDITQYGKAFIVLETAVGADALKNQIADAYLDYALDFGSNFKLLLTEGKSFEEFILGLGTETQKEVDAMYLVGATIAPQQFIAWLNNQPLHTAPLTVNFLHNALARVLVAPDAVVRVTNYPLPFKSADLAARIAKVTPGMINTYILLTLISFVPICVLDPIRERASGLTQLQALAGVSYRLMWLVQYVWDVLFFTLISFSILFVLFCMSAPSFDTTANASRYLLVLICFLLSILPIVYIMTLCFKTPLHGLMFVWCVLFLLFFAILLHDAFIKDSTALKNMSWVVPVFNVYLTMGQLNQQYVLREACTSLEGSVEDLCATYSVCCQLQDYLSMSAPGIGKELIAFLLVALLSMGLLLLMHLQIRNFVQGGCIGKKLHLNRSGAGEHPRLSAMRTIDPVMAESERIGELTKTERRYIPLVVDGMTKRFGRLKAVQNLSFQVQPGECFGLLGASGSGKSTAVKMLTLNQSIRHGNAYVYGRSIRKMLSKSAVPMGYCPQTDTLLENLSGRNNFRIFCLLRGIQREHIANITETVAKELGFHEILGKKVKYYSGGNRRKLCTALALIGKPTIVYLDEPSSGIDPTARQQLWQMIIQTRDMGKPVVLSSHNMDDCEELCTRVGILEAGQFVCLGSTQYLKHMYSDNLILKIKVLRKATEAHRFGSLESIYNSEMQMMDSKYRSERRGGRRIGWHNTNSSSHSLKKPSLETWSRQDSFRSSIQPKSESQSKKSKRAVKTGNQRTSNTSIVSRDLLSRSNASLDTTPKSSHASESNITIITREYDYNELGEEEETEEPGTKRVKKFIDKYFPTSKLIEEHAGLLTYQISMQRIVWSYVFELMERNRSRLHIEDYSVSQTTLEDIFLDFRKPQGNL